MAAAPRPPLRVHESSNGVVALQVVVRDMTPRRRNDPVVRLVGVTHLGSAEYYGRLQSLLDAEPLVLFEGVGARDKRFMSTRAKRYSLQPALAKARMREAGNPMMASRMMVLLSAKRKKQRTRANVV